MKQYLNITQDGLFMKIGEDGFHEKTLSDKINQLNTSALIVEDITYITGINKLGI